MNNNEIKKFKSFIKKLKEFRKNNEGKRLYFRGEHSNHKYSIPSIYRKDKNGISRSTNKFYSDLSVQLGNLKISNLPYSNQLARFQHYEAPTRLLDITENPLVALFFALEETEKELEDAKNDGKKNTEKELKDAEKNDDRTIYFYAVDEDDIKYQDGHTVNMEVTANWMDQKIVNNFISLNEQDVPNEYNPDKPKKSHCPKSVRDFMDEMNRKNKLIEKMTRPKDIYRDLNRSYFVNFIRESTRMKTQQGAFIMPKYLTGLGCTDGQLTDDLQKQIHDSIIKSLDEKGFKKYIIPSKKVKQMRRDINALGVNAGSVYPDIKHYSQFLINSYNKK